MVLLAGIRERMKTSPVPKFMQGTPISVHGYGLDRYRVRWALRDW